MKRIFAFSALILFFFVFEGGFFLQNSAISSYNFLFSKETENPKIIFGGGYIFSDFLYLNKGIVDGVEKDDLIIYDQIVIGKIEEIFPKFSKVVPFSKFSKKTPLRTGEQKSILFEGVGNGAGEINADFPNNLSINIGEGVYLAHNPNYLVGIIDDTYKKEGRNFQKVSIRIPISLNSITDVDIIKSNVSEQ